MKIRTIIPLLGALAAANLSVHDVAAGTAVAPGSGHPENLSASANPWDVSNPNATRIRVADNMVCNFQNGGTAVWITPLAIPTSTGVSTRSINQNRFGSGSSQAWSFNPNGTVFASISESSSTVIGNLSVPAGGTAFVKSLLTSPLDGSDACIRTITFT